MIGCRLAALQLLANRVRTVRREGALARPVRLDPTSGITGSRSVVVVRMVAPLLNEEREAKLCVLVRHKFDSPSFDVCLYAVA